MRIRYCCWTLCISSRSLQLTTYWMLFNSFALPRRYNQELEENGLHCHHVYIQSCTTCRNMRIWNPENRDALNPHTHVPGSNTYTMNFFLQQTSTGRLGDEGRDYKRIETFEFDWIRTLFDTRDPIKISRAKTMRDTTANAIFDSWYSTGSKTVYWRLTLYSFSGQNKTECHLNTYVVDIGVFRLDVSMCSSSQEESTEDRCLWWICSIMLR